MNVTSIKTWMANSTWLFPLCLCVTYLFVLWHAWDLNQSLGLHALEKSITAWYRKVCQLSLDGCGFHLDSSTNNSHWQRIAKMRRATNNLFSKALKYDEVYHTYSKHHVLMHNYQRLYLCLLIGFSDMSSSQDLRCHGIPSGESWRCTRSLQYYLRGKLSESLYGWSLQPAQCVHNERRLSESYTYLFGYYTAYMDPSQLSVPHRLAVFYLAF